MRRESDLPENREKRFQEVMYVFPVEIVIHVARSTRTSPLHSESVKQLVFGDRSASVPFG